MTDYKTQKQKTALITGGSTGIGLATAKQLAREGYRLTLFARNEKDLAAAALELDTEVTSVCGSVTSSADLARLFSTIGSQGDRLDALFVNAGIAEFVALEEMDNAHYDRIFDVNVKGAFMTIQHALPLLDVGSSVVVTTSVAGRIGAPNCSVYGASKGALRAMVRSLGAELLPRGIRVNAVSPGPTETPILGKFPISDERSAEMAPYVAQRMRMGRLGRAEEVASAACFLLSDASSFVVGQEITVDGGMTAL